MILVTVGTHKQQFDRLVKRCDNLAKYFGEEMVIQYGHSHYVPRFAKGKKFVPELRDYIEKARIVIAHAGTGTFLETVKMFKKPIILVPRQRKFREHVNDHQLDFCRHIEKKYGFCVIENIDDLLFTLIKDYNKVIETDEKPLQDLRDFIKKEIDKVI